MSIPSRFSSRLLLFEVGEIISIEWIELHSDDVSQSLLSLVCIENAMNIESEGERRRRRD